MGTSAGDVSVSCVDSTRVGKVRLLADYRSDQLHGATSDTTDRGFRASSI